MKRNEGKLVSAVIAAAVFALMAGCASVPFGDMAAEVQDDLFAESKTYNGGE
jgi:hypothetical protein